MLTERFELVISKEQRRAIKQKAKENKVTMGQYIRTCINAFINLQKEKTNAPRT